MAKKTKGKTARRIDEVTVAQGEEAHDAARTAAPMDAQLEKIERPRSRARRLSIARRTILAFRCELSYAGVLKVESVDTRDNSADLLTKPLDADAYHRHRSRLMNLSA